MSNELIEKKLNEIINKLLGMSKRIKKLEELDAATVGSIEDLQELNIETAHNFANIFKKLEGPTVGPEGGFFPNAKFTRWYTGTFADSEDDAEEKEEEVVEEIIEDTDSPVKDIDEEIIKKLDEVIEDA